MNKLMKGLCVLHEEQIRNQLSQSSEKEMGCGCLWKDIGAMRMPMRYEHSERTTTQPISGHPVSDASESRGDGNDRQKGVRENPIQNP